MFEPKVQGRKYARPLALFKRFGFAFACAFSLAASAASDGPQTFTLDGQLFQSGTTSPLLDANVNIVVEVLDPSKSCVVYSEQQTIDTASTNGYFNIHVGSNVGDPKRAVGDPGLLMSQVFQNATAVTATNAAGSTCASGTYAPSSGDLRYFRLVITPSSTGIADTLAPDMTLETVPNALVAETVQGLPKSGILQVNTASGVQLSQANLQNMFTGSAYSNLQSVMSGSFVASSSNGATLPTAAPSTTPPAGTIWYDSTSHQLEYSTGLAVATLGTAGAGVSSLTMGANLTANGTAGATLSGPGTIDLAVTGVTASTYSKVTVDTYGRVTAGAQITGSDITSGTIGGTTAMNTSGAVSTGSLSTSTITASAITAASLTASGNLIGQNISVNGASVRSLVLNDAQSTPNTISFVAPSAVSSSYSLKWPAGLPSSSGYVLSSDASGNLSWVAASTGSVTSVAAATTSGNPISVGGTATAPTIDIAKATASANGYLSSSDWTTFNNKLSSSLTSAKIFVGNASGVATETALSGDASLSNSGVLSITGLNGTPYVVTSLASGQYLKYDGTNWVNSAISTSDVSGLTTALGNTINVSQMPASCSAGQTLTFTSPSNSWACSSIQVAGANFVNQSANLVLAGPASGVATSPSFRALVAADLPAGAYDASYFKNGGNSFGASATLGTADANSLNFVTGGAARLSIDTSGNVGVGTASPATKLQVVGSLLLGDGGESCTVSYAGALRYNSSTLQLCDGSAWTSISTTSGTISSLTGDVTATGSGAVTATVSKVNGVAYSASPSTNTVPVVTGANTVTYEQVPNAALANSAVGIGTTSVALGGSTSTLAGVTSIGFGTTNAVTIQNPSASSAYNFNLPSTVGTSGYALVSGGGGTSPMTWAAIPSATGSSNITSLGTVTTGTWNASTIGVPYGGTGQTSLGAHGVLLGEGTSAITSSVGGAGTVLQGGGSSADPSFTSTPTFGVNAASTGAIALANGAASGALTTIQPSASTTSAYTLTLPATGGTSGYVLQTDGSGHTSWIAQAGSGTVNSGTANQLAYYSATGTAVSGLTTTANSVLLSDSSGVPAWSTSASDNFTQYALLAGRSGGQTLYGGTGASDSLTLDSTSSSTKGQILIGTSGAKVGIGTTSSSASLQINTSIQGDGVHVIGSNSPINSVSNGTYELDFGVATSTAAYSHTALAGDVVVRAYNASSNGNLILSSLNATGGIRFTTGTTPSNDTAKMTIANSGNVSIGTTSTNGKLDVGGTVALEGSTSGYVAQKAAAATTDYTMTWPAAVAASAGQALVSDTSGNLSWTTIAASGGSNTFAAGSASAPSINFTSDTTSGFYDAGSGVIGVASSGSAAMTLSSSGMTGAGAMTVAAGGTAQNLTLASSTTGSVNIGSGNGTSLSVLDGGASTVDYVSVQGSAAGGTPKIATAGSDTNINLTFAPKGTGSTIFANGRVAIGTTSPAAALQVYGNNVTSSGELYVGDGSNSSNLISVNSRAYFGYDNAGNAVVQSALGKGINFNVNNNTFASGIAMNVSPSGQVGIGTNSANYPLDLTPSSAVSGSNLDALRIYNNTTQAMGNAVSILMTDSNASNALGVKLQAITENATAGSRQSGFAILTSNQLSSSVPTEKVRIAGSGNVGIGTVSPGLRLESMGNQGFPAVSGTTQNGSLRLSQSTSNGVLDLGVGPSGVSWLQSTNSASLANAYSFALNPNGGNVGIGTTSPSAKLDVKGAMALDGTTSGNIAQKAAATTTNYTITWPAAVATSAGQALVSDTSGNLSWTTISGSGGGFANGSGSAPSINFSSDTTTGFYDAGSGVIGVAASGSSAMTLSSTGITGASAMTIAAGGTAQNLTLSSSTTGAVNVGSGNGTSLSVLDGGASTVDYVSVQGAATNGGTQTATSPVIASAGSDTNINLTLTPKGTGNTLFSSGRVGIGTASPATSLNLGGTTFASGGLSFGTGTDGFYASAPGSVNLNILGTTRWTFTGNSLALSAGNSPLINAASPMFRPRNGETSGLGWLNTGVIGLFTSSNTTFPILATNGNNIGVGVPVPTSLFQVSPVQYQTGTATQSGTTVTGVGTTWTAAMVGMQLSYVSGQSAGLITAVGSATSLTVANSLTIATATSYMINSVSLTVSATGNVGIGTTSATSALQVHGGAVVVDPVSAASQSVNFATGNTQVTSYNTTSTVKVCGLADGGNYTLILTGYTSASAVTIAAYSDTACSVSVNFDFGGSTSGYTSSFTTANNTSIISIFYSVARGVAYGSYNTNFYH